MATWSTFRTQVRRELEEATAGIWSDDSLLFWANDAAKDIAVQTKPMRDWQYTTCVADQATYGLPDNSLEIIAVYCGKDADDDRTMLTRVEFRDVWNLDRDSGKPIYYIVDDDAVRLIPTPDDTYELSLLRYILPTPMTADSDSMPFSDRYNAAINYYIKSRAYEQIGDWKGADSLLGRYIAEVDKASVQEGFQANAARFTSPMDVY